MTAVDPALELRPLAAADVAELRRIRAAPEVRRWWGEIEDDFPFGDEPESVRFTIAVDGSVVGMIQYYEENEPRYRHASIDVFVDPARRGQGLGTGALRRLVELLVRERGHHRITIDPTVANAPAIRSYEKAGFQRVGVMRDYEREVDSEHWHDGLLMEYIAPGTPHRDLPEVTRP
jgi:aminoglycoside 6'-N-acetyltransferase